MNRADAIREFFRTYGATPVGATPVQPLVPVPQAEDDEDDSQQDDPRLTAIDRTCERPEDQWEPITIPEQPAKPDEIPRRFIDGAHASQPVVCVRTPQGYPIALVLSEVGAVGLRSVGRGFSRDFVAVERVLSFVADYFPWPDVEEFASALMNKPELQLRVLPANKPREGGASPFDYEVMRTQASSRAQQEMKTLERLALSYAPEQPTLIDGPLNRLMGQPSDTGALRIGVVKTIYANHLHEQGWRTLLSLGRRQRTPVYRYNGRLTDGGILPVVSWFLRLAAGPELAPNWGFVRVEVPWNQFQVQFGGKFDFINRLSGWIIDARCRTASYARMPVSLEPIVRAEESLKPLFTPMQMLANRLYRSAGFFRGHEG